MIDRNAVLQNKCVYMVCRAGKLNVSAVKLAVYFATPKMLDIFNTRSYTYALLDPENRAYTSSYENTSAICTVSRAIRMVVCQPE
jgi:hypothetical protein